MEIYNSFRKPPFNLDTQDICWIDKTLNSLSVEEKAGQLFCGVVREGSEREIEQIKSVFHPGGIMYRPLPVKDAVAYTNSLNKRFKVPMLIAANLESGADGIIYEGSHYSNQMAVAASGKIENAARLGEICAGQAKSVGGNWAFAPVIDIDFNWRNPITNTRTYGSNPELVAAMGEAYTRAVQAKDVAASIKHFPGDGVDERDQHLALTINSLSVEEWDKSYGMAYKRCIDAGALTVMVGHICQPAYSRALRPDIRDDEIMPATLSPELLQGLLREKLGFNGLIVTDASTMNGFTSLMPRKKAVPFAIAAGNDMFLFCRNAKEDFEFMLKGIDEGIISHERLNEAVARILALKAALGLHKEWQEYTPEKAFLEVSLPEYQRWQRELADEAVTLVKEEKGVLPLNINKKKILLFPIEPTGDSAFGGKSNTTEVFKGLLEDEGFNVTSFVPRSFLEGETQKTTELEIYDYMIYIASLNTKSNQTVVRIEWKQPMGADCPAFISSVPTIFISVANPYHLVDVPRVKTFINAYDSGKAMLEAVVDKLMGRSEFKGSSPVDPFCGMWDTHL